MRGWSAVWIIAAAASLASAPALRADITPVNFPNPLPAGSSASGVVTNIDQVNRMVQVRESSGMILTFRVTESVQILRNSEPIRLLDLRLGDFVTVSSK